MSEPPGDRHLLLLRGVNVGGRNRLAMAELRAALSEAGLCDTRTHLQSGNVIVADGRGAEAAAETCRATIAQSFGLQIDVVSRTAAEMAAVVRAEPLGELAGDPRRYLVSFLSEPLAVERVARLRELRGAGEELVAVGRELHTWHPDGVGRSKLWQAVAQEGARSGAPALTARNWSVVTRLLELLQA